MYINSKTRQNDIQPETTCLGIVCVLGLNVSIMRSDCHLSEGGRRLGMNFWGRQQCPISSLDDGDVGVTSSVFTVLFHELSY